MYPVVSKSSTRSGKLVTVILRLFRRILPARLIPRYVCHYELKVIYVLRNRAKVPTVLTVYQQTKRSVYNGIKSALGNFSLS